jgi:hypothetical protein
MGFSDVLGPRAGSRISSGQALARDRVVWAERLLARGSELPFGDLSHQYSKTVNIVFSWKAPNHLRAVHIGIEAVHRRYWWTVHYNVLDLGSARNYFSAEQIDQVLLCASSTSQLISCAERCWHPDFAELQTAVTQRWHAPTRQPPRPSTVAPPVSAPAHQRWQQRLQLWKRS